VPNATATKAASAKKAPAMRPIRAKAVTAPPPPPHVVITPADDDIQFGRVVLTKTMARQWMARNIQDNRNAKPAKQAAYRTDIENQNWRRTGETIKFDVNGDMCDGQNRVQAFLDAEGVESIVVYVAWNVPPEAYVAMDTGAAKTFADHLKRRGLRGTRAGAAAVIRRIIQWEQGNPLGVRNSHGRTYVAPTHSQLDKRYEQDQDRFDAAVARGFDMRHLSIGNSTIGGVAFFLFHQISAEQCHQFFDHLATGADISAAHPCKVLRDRLLRTTEPLNVQLAFYIEAWNAFRDDRPLKRLQRPNDGAMAAARFPRPR